jgi:iron complex transport system permease protein
MKKSAFFVAAAIIFSFALSIFLGAEKLSPLDAICTPQSFSRMIFVNLRLPRSFLCVLSGSLLAGSGAAFQMLFRNPLAEPGILGISSGATMGAVLAACIGKKSADALFAVNFGAFMGAVSAGTLVILVAFFKSRSSSTVLVLLFGTAAGTLYSSVTSILLSANSEKLRTMYQWMLGSFSGRGYNDLLFVLPPFLGTVLILILIAPHLDLLSGGEESASSLGTDTKKLCILVLLAGSMAVSASVCAGGTIGFVGLIAPHIARKFSVPRARNIIFLSMGTGASIMLLSDTFARIVIAPAELPVGTVTSILGVPFFVSLLFSRGKSRG